MRDGVGTSRPDRGASWFSLPILLCNIGPEKLITKTMETILFVILGLVAFLVLVDLGAYVYGAKVLGLGWRWPLRIFRRPSAPVAYVPPPPASEEDEDDDNYNCGDPECEQCNCPHN